MNTPIKALALLAAFGAPTLQAQPDREAPSAEQRIGLATSGLTLTASQQSQLDALASRYADLQPGDSWPLAADLEAVLTDGQIQSLAEKRAAQRAHRSQRHQAKGAGADHRGKTDRLRKASRALGLTEAQQAQMKERRETARAERKALREQLQAGAITDEQFTGRSRVLREQASASFDEVLTPGQRQKREEAEARRDAMRTAREAVLQITPEQKAAFRSVRVEAARSGERGAARGSKREVLTEDQRQIVAVHRALAERSDRHGRGERRNGRLDRLKSGAASE